MLRQNGRRWLPIAILIALLAGTAASADPLGPAPPPDEPGPWAVGRTSFEVFDESRQRSLLVDVWYPVEPSQAGGDLTVYDLTIVSVPSESAFDNPPIAPMRFPLILFSHGNGGVRFQSYFLTEHLATHGFVVVSPDHAGNTLLELLFGDFTDADILQSGLDRPRDISFLIDTMLARSADPDDFFYRRIRRRRIGVTGHSFGGFTSLAMAAGVSGAIAELFDAELPEGFVPIAPDPRVRAIAPLAPSSTPIADEELAGIRIPTLLIGGTSDTTTPIDPEITRPLELLASRYLLRADLLRAGHFSFTNICDVIDALENSPLPPELIEEFTAGPFEEGCAPALIPIDEAQRLTELYTTAFFRSVLVRDPRYQRFLTEAHALAREPDVDFTARPPLPARVTFFLSLLWSFFGRL